jgi:hypothetical protein
MYAGSRPETVVWPFRAKSRGKELLGGQLLEQAPRASGDHGNAARVIQALNGSRKATDACPDLVRTSLVAVTTATRSMYVVGC